MDELWCGTSERGEIFIGVGGNLILMERNGENVFLTSRAVICCYCY
jgi:hypothetical protein